MNNSMQIQKFRTELTPRRASFTLDYPTPILSIGSCFAVHIGERLARYKFPVRNNPFGILYNPASMLQALERLLSGRAYEPGDLFEHQGLWHSYDHHGDFSHPDPEICLQRINESLRSGAQHLADSRRLLLTFGTAFVFEQVERRQIVANCHKVPADHFRRYRLPVREIVDQWAPLLRRLHAQRPALRVIVSVSPVRHLRDGLVENQRSKAALVLALDELCRRLDFLHYFPAYELLLDDLRDYRFYDRDLSHPSPVAVDYIWEHFQATFFDDRTRQIRKRVGEIIAARAHRPLHPGSVAHQEFAARQLEKIAELQSAYPFLDLSEEIAYFRRQKI